MLNQFATFLTIALFLLAPWAPASAQQDDRVLFGVLAFGGKQDAHARWNRTIEALSADLPGREFELVPLTLDGARTALEARELHFLLTNPGHFQKLMPDHELAPLVSLRTDGPGRVRTDNRYGAVIFARASDDGPRRLSDLRGRSFGAVAPEAFGGWQLALHTLERNGLEPARDFSEIRFLGFPQTAIVQAVLDGEIDAGTVRTGVLEAMIAAGDLKEDALTVLNPLNVPNFDLALSTALVPEWLVAATPLADPDLKTAVAQRLLATPREGADDPLWQPPQSLVPVIDVLGEIDAAPRAAPGPDWLPNLLYGATFVAVALALAYGIRRRRAPEQAEQAAPDTRAEHDDLTQAPSVSLTAREGQVLELIESGQTTKEIARILSIAPKTVEFHRHNLMRKFDASNMAELAHRSGLWRQQT